MDRIRQLADRPATARLIPWLPAGLVTLLGLVLLWPIPLGRMPLSADHTVHLTRAWMWANELAGGHMRGWSPVWFFGTPVGELYPVAGDAIIVTIRTLSLGLASWPTAYAVGFTLVFLIQGWALLRAARLFGLGPVAGTVAALILLADVGEYREGGWVYTVEYGVWPQALATGLVWWGLGELYASLTREGTDGVRALGRSGLVLGTAVLAHPMTLPVALVGASVVVVGTVAGDRRRFRALLGRASLVGLLAIGCAAWWLFPMLEHRAWMASYGWLWRPLGWMLTQVGEGHLAQNVPAVVTVCALVGAVAAVFTPSRGPRVVAALAILLWFGASIEAFWSLRLDRVSEGFTHVQYQRFLLAAKPGFFLLAGAVVGGLVAWKPRDHRLRIAAVAAGVLVGGALGQGQAAMSRAHDVGTPQIARFPDAPAMTADYDQLVDHLREQWEGRDEFYRLAARAPRNMHWFMDAPALSGAPLYKMGFTPGDNFVHKPESRRREVLSALGVQHVIERRDGEPRDDELVRFGDLVVRDAPGEPRPLAWLRGPGTLELETVDPTGTIRGSIAGATAETTLVFGVAGFPRWELTHEGAGVEWHETPVWGDGADATPAQRRAGSLRGGKVHGNDGSEPTLIAAHAQNGSFELRYRSRRPSDVFFGLISLVSLAICGTMWLRPAIVGPRLARIEAAAARAFHPVVVGALVLAALVALATTWTRAAAAERGRASGWVEAGFAETRGLAVAPFKADMLLRPAVSSSGQPGDVSFPSVSPRELVTGWIALDDDHTKMRARGHHTVVFEVSPVGEGAWQIARTHRVRHRPGRVLVEIPIAVEGRFDLRVRIETRGDRPPPLGFDLELGAPAGEVEP